MHNTVAFDMDRPHPHLRRETILTQDRLETTGIQVQISGKWVIGDTSARQEAIGATLIIFTLLLLNAGTTQMIVDDTILREGMIGAEAIVGDIETMMWTKGYAMVVKLSC